MSPSRTIRSLVVGIDGRLSCDGGSLDGCRRCRLQLRINDWSKSLLTGLSRRVVPVPFKHQGPSTMLDQLYNLEKRT